MGTKWRDFPPGDENCPTAGWWLLVTSLDETSPVSPGTLLICPEILRTLVDFYNTLYFHLADIFCGKFNIQHLLQLLGITFCRQAKIRLLHKQTYTFETPVTVLEALSVVHDGSTTNMGNHRLRRTVWQDRRAIVEQVTPYKVRPNYF